MPLPSQACSGFMLPGPPTYRRCIGTEHTCCDRREPADSLAGAGLLEHGAGSGKSRDRVIDAGTLGLIRVEAVVRKCGRRGEQQNRWRPLPAARPAEPSHQATVASLPLVPADRHLEG